MAFAAEREDALLGAACFLVAARAADGSIEPVAVECLLQCGCLHDVRIERGREVYRVDAARCAIGIDVDDEIKLQLTRDLVPECDHLAKFPGGIDVQ